MKKNMMITMTMEIKQGIFISFLVALTAVNAYACPGGKCPFHKAVIDSGIKREKSIDSLNFHRYQTVVVPISGMTCQTCEFHVNRALKNLGGVKEAHANAKNGTATVVYDSAKVNLAQIAESVNKLGYKVTLPTPKTEKK